MMLHFSLGQLKKYIESESFGLIVEPPEKVTGQLRRNNKHRGEERLRESLVETKNLTVLGADNFWERFTAFIWFLF